MRDEISRDRTPTAWYRIEERPITREDEGMLVVGQDRFGVGLVGILARDGFGLVVREWHPQAVDVRSVPVDRVAVYALLDPPV